jgi:hypothetical protein
MKASKKQIKEWSSEIIKTSKLSSESQFSDISNAIVDFFRKIMPKYKIYANDVYRKNVSFTVLKEEDKKKEKEVKQKEKPEVSSIFDSLLGISTEPLTEEEKKIASILKKTFLVILEDLGKLHPINYPEILKKIGLNELKKAPKSNFANITNWSTKIIDYFSIKEKTSISALIKNTMQFFDMIFPNYEVYYQEFKDKNAFPLMIDRIGDDSLAWATEIMYIRLNVYATYQTILEKFNRKNDYPKDSEFYYNLALIFDEMGLKDQSNKYGDYGLSLPPRDTYGLSELITYYTDNKRFSEMLKYLKRMGDIYNKKDMKKLALQMWQLASRFDTGLDVVSNLIILYKELGMKKELDFSLDYISKNINKYKGIEELLKKLDLKLK